jgi:hypothetical protein
MSGITENRSETSVHLDPDIYFVPKGDKVENHREYEIPDELIPEFLENPGLFREQHSDLFHSS